MTSVGTKRRRAAGSDSGVGTGEDHHQQHQQHLASSAYLTTAPSPWGGGGGHSSTTDGPSDHHLTSTFLAPLPPPSAVHVPVPYTGDPATVGAAGLRDSTNLSGTAAHHHHPSWSESPLRSTNTYSDVSAYTYPRYHFPTSSDTTASFTHPWPQPGDPGFVPEPSAVSAAIESANMPYFTGSANDARSMGVDVANSTGPQFPQGREIISHYGNAPLHRQADHDQQMEQSPHVSGDSNMQMKMQSLTILESLANQLIHTLAKASYPQIQTFTQGHDSEESQAYTTLKNLFDQTRRVYSRESPFIDAIAVQMLQSAQQEIIRKANLATFISSILGAHDVSFFHLNEFFIETFVPLGHRLLKWQGAIYLELKTQAYISALINSDGNPDDILDEIFPSDLDAQILTRHPDAPSLSPSEQDFVDRSRARKSYLLAENAQYATNELPKKYQWTDFAREFASCISKNVDAIMSLSSRVSQPHGSATTNNGPSTGSRAGSTQPQLRRTSAATTTAGVGPTGSDPTNPLGRKPSTSVPSIRQAWTKPEEDALLDGLERVNGPHWSQILALYGRGGSASEVLKDRNQVQLKDKARNLKLWYLKMGKDVPEALKGVTGELRKRGGARARAALEMMDDPVKREDREESR